MSHPSAKDFVYFRFPLLTELKADGTVKKVPLNPWKWTELTHDTMKKHHKDTTYRNGKLYDNNAVAVLTGKINNITVFDFDDIKKWEQIYETHKDEIDTFYKVKTRKGFHLYFNYNPKYKESEDKSTGIDIRNDGGLIYSPPTKYRMPDGTVAKYEFVGGELRDAPDWMDDYLIEKHFVNSQPIKIKVKKERKQSTSSNFSSVSQQSDSGVSTSSAPNQAVIKSKLDRISTAISSGFLDEKVDDRDEWVKVGMIIYHTCEGNDEMLEYGANLFDTFSRRSANFEDEPEANNIATFRSFAKPHKKPITFSTFTKWEKEWKKNDPNIKIATSDKHAAEMVYEMIKDKLICSRGTLYYRSGIAWKTKMSEIESGLLNTIMNSEIYAENEKGDIMNFVQEVPRAKRVREALMALAQNPENCDDDLYEKFHATTLNKLCFKNGVFCFNTKTFTKWEDVEPNTIYTTLTANRNYNANADYETKSKIIEKIFKPLFGDSCDLALTMFARMISGNVKDKTWMNYIGPRNSGKGVCEALFRATFGEYISAISSDLFIADTSRKTNDVKELAWMMEMEFARVCFMNECAETAKYSGKMLKEFNSGGDWKTSRRNREDPRQFKMDAGLIWFNNTGPTIRPIDVYKTCFQHTSANSFQTKEFIEERIADDATEEEMATYSVQDEYIKDVFVKEEKTCDAFFSLLVDAWKSNKIEPPKFDVADDDEGSNFIAAFYSAFQITKRDGDRVSISELKEWCERTEIKYKQIQGLLGTCGDAKSGGARFKTGIKKLEDKKEQI